MLALVRPQCTDHNVLERPVRDACVVGEELLVKRVVRDVVADSTVGGLHATDRRIVCRGLRLPRDAAIHGDAAHVGKWSARSCPVPDARMLQPVPGRMDALENCGRGMLLNPSARALRVAPAHRTRVPPT